MDLSAATGWWVAAGIAVAAELGTGTFYLLMIAFGLAAAAIAAHLGLPLPSQMVTGAIVGAGATAAWWAYRHKYGVRDSASHQNRDVNLDIGERVQVRSWAPDRTARVHYRGSTWTARLAPQASPQAGEHLVTAVEGNWLILTPTRAG